MRGPLFCLFLLTTISGAGQSIDSTRTKFAVGLGWSFPIGLCAHAQVLPLKKFGAGVMISASKRTTADDWSRSYYDSAQVKLGDESAYMNPTGLLSVSVMGTLYVLGKNRDSPAALTLSSGFGVLIKKHSWHVAGSGTRRGGEIISTYDGMKISTGLSFLVSPGCEFRIGKGAGFIEIPLVFYPRTFRSKYSWSNLSGPEPPPYFFIYEKGQETLGTYYFNIGYKRFF